MDDANSSSLSDLKDALKETLEARGSLGQIKARIRAEIFAALDDESVPKPTLSNENLLINELIREYLAYNGYRHSHSVFLAESGQPTEPAFQRDFLAHELKVTDDPRFTHVPLLYGVVASLQRPRDLDNCQIGEHGPHEFIGDPQQSSERQPRASPSPNDRSHFESRSSGAEPSPLLYQK